MTQSPPQSPPKPSGPSGPLSEPAPVASLPALPPLREVIARHGLAARKGLGQHFLLDLNVTAKIARAAGPLTEGCVIEIGPGPGGLTRALLAAGTPCLIAVERDERCLGALAELSEAWPGRLRVVAGDALAVDCTALGPPPRRIVANLPYNIGTTLLLQWLDAIAARGEDAFHSLTLMFQKEVADRLVAPPRSPAYGRLAVAAQSLCTVERLFTLPPAAFTPPPRVSSAVVSLIPRAAPVPDLDWPILQRVTAAAFGQRRKMLRQSLKPLRPAFGGPVDSLIAAAGLSPTARAEELSLEDFWTLTRIVAGKEPIPDAPPASD